MICFLNVESLVLDNLSIKGRYFCWSKIIQDDGLILNKNMTKNLESCVNSRNQRHHKKLRDNLLSFDKYLMSTSVIGLEDKWKGSIKFCYSWCCKVNVQRLIRDEAGLLLSIESI